MIPFPADVTLAAKLPLPRSPTIDLRNFPDSDFSRKHLDFLAKFATGRKVGYAGISIAVANIWVRFPKWHGFDCLYLIEYRDITLVLEFNDGLVQ